MRSTLPVLLLVLAFVSGSSADARKSYQDARRELERAYFDEMKPDERDRLFEAFGRFDDRQVISPLGDLIARYGTYMAGLEARAKNYQDRLRPFLAKQGLTDQETGVRNSLQRKIGKLETETQAAEQTLALMGRIVGAYEDPKTIENALTLFAKNRTWRVRQVLAMACSGWHKFLHDEATSKKALKALGKLFTDAEPRVRVEVVRSMGHFKSADTMALLSQAMKDDDWRVRGQAVRSLARRKNAAAVTILVNAMKGEKGRMIDDINRVLKAITGQDFKYPEQWAGWWKGVGEKIPRMVARGSDTRDTGRAGKQPRKRKADFRFYGIPTNSDRICYIIDVSGSMKKEVEEWKQVTITGRKEADTSVQGKTRMDVAKNELKRAVYNLNSKKQFTIIFFSHKVKAWQAKPVFATRENKQQAMKDTELQKPSGATYTLGALREAFAIAGVIGGDAATTGKGSGLGIDTIFLLSDGGPTDNAMAGPKPMEPGIILEQVKRWNKDAGITIHTIAVHTDPIGTHFLKMLAAQNGGMFVERKNPTKNKKK